MKSFNQNLFDINNGKKSLIAASLVALTSASLVFPPVMSAFLALPQIFPLTSPTTPPGPTPSPTPTPTPPTTSPTTPPGPTPTPTPSPTPVPPTPPAPPAPSPTPTPTPPTPPRGEEIPSDGQLDNFNSYSIGGSIGDIVFGWQQRIAVINSASGIHGTQNDQLHYYATLANGDFTFVTRMTVIDPQAPMQGGLMVRENLGTKSRLFGIVAEPDMNRRASIYRKTEGGRARYIISPQYDEASRDYQYSQTIWLKLERRGNLFIVSESLNGSNWQQVKKIRVDLNSQLYVGLFAASGDRSSVSNHQFAFTSYTDANTSILQRLLSLHK